MLALTLLGATLGATPAIFVPVGPQKPLPKPPAAILATLRKWGAAFEVPLSWLTAVSFVESTHQPEQVNMTPAAARKGGAWGLMQQMANEVDYKLGVIKEFYGRRNPKAAAFWRGTPADIRMVAATAAKWKGDPKALLDLDLNIMLAAWQLGRLRRVFGNDFRTVMAAYHQGETAVQRRLAAGLPAVDMANQPAGAEYVVRAILARNQYRALT